MISLHLYTFVATVLLLASTVAAVPLPDDFTIENLMRTVDLTKTYSRETISLILKSKASTPVSSFYWSLNTSLVDEAQPGPKLSIFDVKRKGGDGTIPLTVLAPSNSVIEGISILKIDFDEAIFPGETATISIASARVFSSFAQPSKIKQGEAQVLVWDGGRSIITPYTVVKQRTKVRVADRPPTGYSRDGDDPKVDGNTLTYGPYSDVPPMTSMPIRVKYEYNKPMIVVDKLERELWVSHTGGNLATEENYWLHNGVADLSDQFSRIRWQASVMTNEKISAIKEIPIQLRPGARDVYFTDEIGNVSTSHFNALSREPLLQISPRYPVFGGWNYSFTLGWNHDVGRSLRQSILPKEDGTVEDVYILRVPLIEGPENAVYKKVDVSVVLPEGAEIEQVSSTYTNLTESRSLRKSHLDAKGRPVVTLSASSLVDEHRKHELYVIYKYSNEQAYAKPLLVASAVGAIFLAFIVLTRMDTSISKTA
ncbi:Ribophorin I [Lipomyces oligophaga]|uniref:Ribophorin I n=1 Tax=Lipomyces oligophaga TaxID=45792 RepID=UPI0034CDE910